MTCASCNGVGWLCAATDTPADWEHGTCCNPTGESRLGPGCVSANGCPDCDRARRDFFGAAA